MRVANELDIESAQSAAATGMARWGLASLAVGLGGSVLLNRVSPAFRNARLPFKVFAVTMMTCGGAATGGEVYIIRHERSMHAPVVATKDHHLDTYKAVLNRCRFHIIGGLWAVSLAGSLALSFSNPHLAFHQKLVHARVYSQSLTMTGLVIAAALIPLKDPSVKHNEKESWRVILEQQHLLDPEDDEDVAAAAGSPAPIAAGIH
eukprot:Opistho-2@86723